MPPEFESGEVASGNDWLVSSGLVATGPVGPLVFISVPVRVSDDPDVDPLPVFELLFPAVLVSPVALSLTGALEDDREPDPLLVVVFVDPLSELPFPPVLVFPTGLSLTGPLVDEFPLFEVDPPVISSMDSL